MEDSRIVYTNAPPYLYVFDTSPINGEYHSLGSLSVLPMTILLASLYILLFTHISPYPIIRIIIYIIRGTKY